jgi:hypothetical protein
VGAEEPDWQLSGRRPEAAWTLDSRLAGDHRGEAVERDMNCGSTDEAVRPVAPTVFPPRSFAIGLRRPHGRLDDAAAQPRPVGVKGAVVTPHAPI